MAGADYILHHASVTGTIKNMQRARKLLLVLLALAAAAGAWLMWLDPAPAPPSGLAGVDVHAHAAGIGAGGSGAFVSPELENSYKFPIYLRTCSRSDDFGHLT